MELKEIITTYQDGSSFINNWQYYYAELYYSGKYKLENKDSAKVVFKHNLIFICDYKGEMIWESGRSEEDIKLMADIAYNQCLAMYVGFSYNTLPKLKIGLDVAKQFRRIKTQMEKEAVNEKIRKELNLNSDFNSDIPVNIHTLKSGKEWKKSAAEANDFPFLWDSIWKENEIALLFADSNIGKSIYAMQMAFKIAESQKVIYFDYEMDETSFHNRTSDKNGVKCAIPSLFFRCEPNRDVFLSKNAESIIVNDIVDMAKENKAKVIIIDNITYICKSSSSAASISYLVYKLKKYQKELGLSILLIAHTAKRNPKWSITQNDLAGNKRLFNFMDSVFALGQSAQKTNLRYLKQLKSRNGRIIYGEQNVMLLEKKFSDGWLHFEPRGFDKEENHLKLSKKRELLNTIEEVKRLSAEGLNQCEISRILEISRPKVNRIIKLLNSPATPDPAPDKSETKSQNPKST